MNFDEKTICQLEALKNQLFKIENDLSLEEVLIDSKLATRLEQQKKQISPIVAKYEKLKQLETELENITDDELSQFKNEIEQNNKYIENIKNEIVNLLIEQKNRQQTATIEIENQNKNCDKICIFLQKTYENICKNSNFDCKTEKMDQSGNIIKKVILNITGQNCFDIFKFENGVHKSNAQNVLVSVYPTIEMPKIEFGEKDIKIDIYRSNGAGGQNVNKVSTAIRVTHLKTGIVATCQDERSQFQNKQRAIESLKQKVIDKTKKDYIDKQKSERKIYAKKDVIKIYDFEKSKVFDCIDKIEYDLDEKQIEANLKSKMIRR